MSIVWQKKSIFETYVKTTKVILIDWLIDHQKSTRDYQKISFITYIYNMIFG